MTEKTARKIANEIAYWLVGVHGSSLEDKLTAALCSYGEQVREEAAGIEAQMELLEPSPFGALWDAGWNAARKAYADLIKKIELP